MGNCWKSCLKYCGYQKEQKKTIVLLIAGLDNAGKTSVVNYLQNGVTVSQEKTVPTIGFRTATIQHKLCHVKLYDVGGGKQIRALWTKYYSDVHGVIFIVDASDHERISEAAEVFQNLACHKLISKKPILLLGNKQDLENAFNEMELIELINIERVANFIKSFTRVVLCSLEVDKYENKKVCETIDEGFQWIVETILKLYDTLNSRIVDDARSSKNLRGSIKTMRSWSGMTNALKDFDDIRDKKHASTYYTNTYNRVKRKKRKLLKYIFRMHSNKTAPLSPSFENGSKPVPFRDDFRKVIRNMNEQDLVRTSRFKEVILTRGDPQRILGKLQNRPRSAPVSIKFYKRTNGESKIEMNKEYSRENHKKTDYSVTHSIERGCLDQSSTNRVEKAEPNFDLIESADANFVISK